MSLSIGARPWCDVSAAVSKAQPAFAWRARERFTALAVYGEEAQHTRVRRARRAALVVIASCMAEGHSTGDKPHSIGARPCCDVLAAASNTQPTFAWHARERATALAVSRYEAHHARLRRARAMLLRWQ